MSNTTEIQEFKYETIPGVELKPLTTKEMFLEENKFANFSLEELREIFDQYRFFCNNGYTPKNTELDKIREKICEEIPFGVTAMQMQLLTAIVVKWFWGD